MASPSSRRKYLVEIHYADHLYPADFYAKVNNVNRYRLRTNQQAAGKLGGTVLAILAEVVRADQQACLGFIAAALLDETSDANTKRFRMYIYILKLAIDPRRYQVLGQAKNSRIFVLPVAVAAQPEAVAAVKARYERIFAETF